MLIGEGRGGWEEGEGGERLQLKHMLALVGG